MVNVQFYTLDDMIEELTSENITTIRAQKLYRDIPLFYMNEGKKTEIMHTKGLVVVSALKENEIKLYEEVAGIIPKLARTDQTVGKLEERVDNKYNEIKNKLKEGKFEVRKGIYTE